MGLPLNPGAPCQGEDSKFYLIFFNNQTHANLLLFIESIYRRGARRWKNKFYHVNGHRFQAKRLNQRTECTICHDYMWGLGRSGFRCVDCGMCVHKKCHRLVRRPCTTVCLISFNITFIKDQYLGIFNTTISNKYSTTTNNNFYNNHIKHSYCNT